VLAYASSQHHATVDEFVQEVRACKAQGFKGYKIHPPSPGGGHDYKLDIEVLKAVRQAAGDDFPCCMIRSRFIRARKPSRLAGSFRT